MASISTSTECKVNFTDEEKEILQSASDICKRIGSEFWRGNGTDEEDEAAYFFNGISGSIKNALKGNYWMP